MVRYTIFLSVFFAGFLFGREWSRLELRPIDFEQNDQTLFLSTINQIESDGKYLYLRSIREPEIMVITPEGKLIRRIGGRGGHPSEFGIQGVQAMTVHGNELWAIDAQLQRVRRFVDGRYLSSFLLRSFNYYHAPQTSNVFAFSKTEVVVPADPKTGHLASVLKHDGTKVRDVGDFIPYIEDLQRKIPGINDTLWLYDAGHWFSIHKFFPLVTRYDGAFNVVSQFQIESKTITEMFEGIQEFSPNPNFNVPLPLFTDAKIHEGDLYLMSKGRLHRIDLESGRVKSVTVFYGTGPDFAQVTLPNVTLFFFAFLDDGRLFLAHPAMLWNHDLWSVKLEP